MPIKTGISWKLAKEVISLRVEDLLRLPSDRVHYLRQGYFHGFAKLLTKYQDGEEKFYNAVAHRTEQS